MTIEQVLESITEAIRTKRRRGPTFPTVFDLSHITWNTEQRRIELDLFDNGRLRKFDLLLDEVSEHGETSIVEEVEIGSNGKSDKENLS